MECLRYQRSQDTENKTHDSSNKAVQGDSVSHARARTVCCSRQGFPRAGLSSPTGQKKRMDEHTLHFMLKIFFSLK